MPSQRQARKDATRERALAVARRLFTEHGYTGTSTGAVLEAADLARGGLYYHFTDKQDLFRAVFEQVEQHLVARVVEAAYTDPARPLWDRVVAGVEEFMSAASEPEVQRIVLTEGPAVLGKSAWRELDERYGLGLIKRVIEQAISEGLITPRPVEPLARLLLAALNEAATTIAEARNQQAAREEMTNAVIQMLNDVRASG
jgi:AcrR family transcriptional regulator